MTPFRIEKMAVFAPIPSASVRMATDAKTGVRRSARQPVTHVLHEFIEPPQQLDVTARFAQAQPIAELLPRRGLRRLAARSCGDEFFNAGFDMKGGFLVESAVDARRAKHVGEA